MKATRTWRDLPLVEVVWTDACIDQDQVARLDEPTAEQAKFGGLVTCRDVGYLVHKDRKVVILAVGVCEYDNSYRHSNTIPRGWVKEIVNLTRAETVPKEGA